MKLKKNIQRVVIALTIVAIGSTGMPNIAFGAEAKTINSNVLKTVAKVVSSSFSTKFVNYTKVNRNFTFTGKISGIKAPQAIKVYIDKTRVYAALSTDKYGNFTYNVPIKNYKFANHVIKFTAKLKNGKNISLSRTMKYSRFMTFGMDTMDPGIVYTEKVVLNGWALSFYGIKSVKVFVDNMKTPVGNATLGLPSEDIGKIYNYKNSANSGFQYDLNVDMEKYKAGTHKIKVDILGNDGLLKTKTYNVIFGAKTPYFAIDGLKDNFVSKNTDILLKGWFIMPVGGAEKVRVFLDDVEQPGVLIGLDRSDIAKKYIDYDTAGKSGFELNMPINKIKKGNHNLRVEFISNDVVIGINNMPFSVVKPEAKITVDKPVFKNTATGKSLTLTGYGVHASGVTAIQVLVDGVSQPNVTIGLSNLTAEKKYSKYPGYDSAGYIVVVDVSSWSLSQHVVSVILTGTDGDQLTYVKDMGLDVVTYAFMDNTLTYYKDAENSRGRNTSYYDPKVSASYDELEMYINTINYVNDPQYKYVFMKLNYFNGITAEMLDKALIGKGVLEGKGKVFLAAGKVSNTNPIYLVAHALLETGNGLSKLSKGILVSNIQLNTKDPLTGTFTLVPVKKPIKVYNMFGVGAYNADPNDFGSSMAYTGGIALTAYTVEEQINVLNGDYAWNTVDKAIMGGAKFIGCNYANAVTYSSPSIELNDKIYKGDIKYQQNTIYKMKFNLFAMENIAFSPHQYATDVGWARKQTLKIKALLDIMDNPEVQYEVPIFVEE